METLLWVLVPLLILGIGWWWLARTRRRTSDQVAAAIGPQSAADAAALLDTESHRAVYRKLATGDFMGAVQAYRVATGQGIRQSIIAIRSLETHPQVHRAPASPVDQRDAAQPAPTDPAPPSTPPNEEAVADATGTTNASEGTGGAERADGTDQPAFTEDRNDIEPADATADATADDPRTPGGDALTIPDDWTEQFGSSSSQTTSTFRISAEVDGNMREFSTEELPPAEYDQFQSLIRDHDFTGAAALMARFSGLEEDSIRRLLESAPVEGPASAASKNVSDFSFEGDGPDGRVSFSAADLPGGDRQLFLDHVGAGRTDEAAAIVHRHTGLPIGVVVKLLSAFGGRH
ncbi:hypothetical protein [Arthrobacter sp. KK5.5]|uniref:hypothetical protein n=1 Tax=Arthrobacter sp. KK5.5 TaxID=3373084 RepID=UPI003EE63E91